MGLQGALGPPAPRGGGGSGSPAWAQAEAPCLWTVSRAQVSFPGLFSSPSFLEPFPVG